MAMMAVIQRRVCKPQATSSRLPEPEVYMLSPLSRENVYKEQAGSTFSKSKRDLKYRIHVK